VSLERRVEAGLRDVERVRVLHRELAHAQHARFGPRLVAELGLDLVPDLRQLLVAAQLAGKRREHLFVGHAERHVGALAVDEPEHLLAHHLPAPRALPDLRGVQRGQLELLAADRVHLRAHDRGDLAHDALPERKQGVGARHELADVARAHEQLVAHGFGVGGVVAQRGDEGFGPAHGAPRGGMRCEPS